MSWISVRDNQKPAKYHTVLLYAPYMDFMDTGYFDGDKFILIKMNERISNKDLTHWQPLPQPPKEK